MKKDKIRPKQSIDLRKRAEELLSKKPEDIQNTVEEDTQKLIHELEVYQIELEMQNEELREAQAELEESRTKYFDLYDLAPIGYFTFDQKGLILEVNLTGAELLGVERKYLLKRGFSRFVVPDLRDVFHLHCQRTFATGTKQTCDLKLVKKDRKQFYAQLQSAVAQDAEGSFIQLRTTISDLTDLKKAEQAVQETRRYAENIVQTVREPLVVLDESLRVVSANRSFYQTFEVTPEETIEEFIYDLGNGQWDIAKLHNLLELTLSSNTFFENFEVEHEFETLGKRLMLLNARRLHTATKGIHLILLAIEDRTHEQSG